MLDLESGRALVPGSAQPKEAKKMKVKCVLRFWLGGRLVEKDEVVEVDEAVAREVIGSRKAIEAPQDHEPQPQE
jgi:hypothetical protein